MGTGTAQFKMTNLDNTMVVLKNGEVVGMHPTKDAADQQVQELIQEWQRYSDNGSESRAPKLAVLSFDDWMRLNNELVF
jgi:hypothetical protein